MIGGVPWLLCDRHMLRWLCDGDPALLGNPRSGNDRERHYERCAPIFFAHPHPANILVAEIRDATLPRIRAGSAARREREAKQVQKGFTARRGP